MPTRGTLREAQIKIQGFIHNTLTEYLSAGFQGTVFDTREVCVYDGDRLIAVSYFDWENKAWPAYSVCTTKHTPNTVGTYTLLKEVEYDLALDASSFIPVTFSINAPISITSLSLVRWSTTPPRCVG